MNENSGRDFPTGAMAVGFFAFLSTIYVLENHQPLVALLTITPIWVAGCVLVPKLSGGRWRVVGEYLRARREFDQEELSVRRSEAPPVEEADLSGYEREQFAKLMGSAGFDAKWPRG